MATEDLLQIVVQKGIYTDLAVEVAGRELQQRKVPIEVIKETKAPEDPYESLWLKNCLFDLNVAQKAAFYFFWLPVLVIHRYAYMFNYKPVWLDFKSAGYILKGQQTSLYKITGAMFFALSIMLGNASTFGNGEMIFLICWVLGFIVAFLFDISFNRQRLTDKLETYKESGELPWGV